MSRYVLRFGALGYLGLPAARAGRRSSSTGPSSTASAHAWDAVTTPEAHARVLADAADGGDRGAARTRSSGSSGARARARPLPRTRRSLNAVGRPAVRALAGRRRARARACSTAAAAGSAASRATASRSSSRCPGWCSRRCSSRCRSSCARSCRCCARSAPSRSRRRRRSARAPLQTFRRITLPAIRWARRLRRRAHDRARARRVRRGQRRLRATSRARRRRCRSTSRPQFEDFDTAGAYAASVVLALIAIADRRRAARLPARRRTARWASPSVDVTQALRRLHRARRRLGRDPGRLADRAARPERQRQVDAAARHRRARGARLGPGPDRRRGRHRHAGRATRGVGFVFQHYAAFKHMTVHDNVAFGLAIRKRPKAEIRERVHELLELVQLDGLAEALPGAALGRPAAAHGARPRARGRAAACCCSTSRSARSTRASARSCAPGCAACTTRCT